MSSEAPAIVIEELSKSYRIVSTDDRSHYFTDVVARRLRAPFRRAQREDVRALDDVSLEIAQGEAVGIIGRNGAGKSTLLKILSRVTTPTAGRVELYGRVGSLLEVGTGFHPELTGRENIFLNGAVLGMRRREIEQSFDSIVEFSEIERFLETPVKRYSSGMYVRLAFAVAAHLNPDILLVDEVLAVGDVQFQKKCLGKMGEVSTQDGRTVLFASHQMPAIEAFCRRCIVIDQGHVVFDGAPSEAIEIYLASSAGSDIEGHPAAFDLSEIPRPRHGQSVLKRVELRRADGTPAGRFPMGEPIELTVGVEGLHVPRHVMTVGLRNEQNIYVLRVSTAQRPIDVLRTGADQRQVTITFPNLPLLPGMYYIDLHVEEHGHKKVNLIDSVDRAAAFEILPADVFGSGTLGHKGHAGILYADSHWQIRSADGDVTGVTASAAVAESARAR